MRIPRILAYLGAAIVVGGCSSDNGTLEPEPEIEATYVVKFDATWSATSHPESFPGNPHFSSLVGATHNESVSFWSVGSLATTGIKNVAERGVTGAFQDEIEAAIDSETAQFSLQGGGIGTSPGQVSLTFTTTIDYPQLTLVSMLAPSPDWFVGVSGLSLLQDDAWVDSLTVELFIYDAGTDSGISYTSADEATAPPVEIRLIDSVPALVDGEIRSVGEFSFIRQ